MSNQHISAIVTFLFEIQLITQLYHWKTKSFARHKASDEFGVVIKSLIDKFVESYMGKYNVVPNIENINIKYDVLNDDKISEYYSTCRDKLINFNNHIKKEDSDLLNIRDELLAETNKLLYLFTLK